MNDGTYAFIMLELNIDNAVRNLADQALWFDGEYIETNTLSEASKELYHSVLLMNVNPNRGKAYDQFVYDMKVAMSKAPFYSQEYEGTIVRRNRTYYNFNKKVCFLAIIRSSFYHLYPYLYLLCETQLVMLYRKVSRLINNNNG